MARLGALRAERRFYSISDPRNANKLLRRIRPLLVLFLAVGAAQLGCVQTRMESVQRINLRDRASIQNRKPVLIAHRGGVVTPATPECSLAAIRLAKEQGFALVELDIQQSRDGVPIVFHDKTLEDACGIEGRIADMDSEQIADIPFSQSDQTIVALERALTECHRLSLGIMLDVKVRDDEEFFRRIAALIKKHGVEASTMTINSDPTLRDALGDSVMLTVTGEEFRRVRNGESVDLEGRYWFGLPHRIPDEAVRLLHQSGAYVIPAINTFRYPEENHYESARRDVERLTRMGVEGFQIDSVYVPLFDSLP